MNFWKEHMGLRGLVIFGWTLKGQLAGLGLMMAGVVLLLAALMIYNKPFEH